MLRGPLDTGLYRFLHLWLPTSFRILYRMKITGLENIPREGGVLLACNHVSNTDPIFAALGAPRQVHFMAKSELWKFAPLGWIMNGVGSFPVRRGQADRQAVTRALEVLKAGAALGVFPEGHRQPPGQLGEAQPGVSMFATRSAVVTIPVAVVGTERVWKGWRPGFPQVSVHYGPPVDTTVQADTKVERHRIVADRLMAAIARLLEQDRPQSRPGRSRQ